MEKVELTADLNEEKVVLTMLKWTVTNTMDNNSKKRKMNRKAMTMKNKTNISSISKLSMELSLGSKPLNIAIIIVVAKKRLGRKEIIKTQILKYWMMKDHSNSISSIMMRRKKKKKNLNQVIF